MAPNYITNGRQTQRAEIHPDYLQTRRRQGAHTHLEVSKEPAVALQDGVHAVRHRHRVLPVVVRDPAVVLLHGHDETTQLLQLEAVCKRHCQHRNW